jgi:uncharacterized membrane protein YeaQ/YmgE (transglycosylase-associated protein family)
MGIIAWIVLGLGAGLLANMLIPGRRSQGLIITCVIGIAGALLGGWLATKLFHVVTLHGFFNLSTWLTAIAGAAVLLLAYHLVTSRGSGRSRSTGRSRSRRWAPLPVAGGEKTSGLRWWQPGAEAGPPHPRGSRSRLHRGAGSVPAHEQDDKHDDHDENNCSEADKHGNSSRVCGAQNGEPGRRGGEPRGGRTAPSGDPWCDATCGSQLDQVWW